MAEVTLFASKYSPFAQRVQIALKAKDIPFELVTVNFPNKPQALLDANPIHGKVPTIVHNGKPVAESLVILEYLEDTFPEQVPFMPKDAFEKSKVRFWTDYIYQGFTKVTSGLKAPPGTPEKAAAAEASAAFFKALDAAMTSYSADGPFFTGDKFGYLDVVLAPICSALGLVKTLGAGAVPGPDELPRLHRWIDAVKVYPSVSSTLPSVEDTLEYIRARFAKVAVAPPQ